MRQAVVMAVLGAARLRHARNRSPTRPQAAGRPEITVATRDVDVVKARIDNAKLDSGFAVGVTAPTRSSPSSPPATLMSWRLHHRAEPWWRAGGRRPLDDR
jgi:hypothetical protein